MKLNIWSSLGIVVIVLLIITAWYLFQLNTTMKSNNDQLVRQKADLEKQLTDEVTYKKNLEKDLGDVKAQREALQSKIGELNGKLQDVTNEFSGKIHNYEQELAALRDDHDKKEETLRNKDKEIDNLNTIIKSHEKKIEELKSKLIAAAQEQSREAEGAIEKETVTLSPITVKSKTALPPVEAKVLEVNKDYGFIVINAGNRQGLHAGDSLFVFRNNQLLGKVVVEKVGETASVAKILYKSLEYVVRKGDAVRN